MTTTTPLIRLRDIGMTFDAKRVLSDINLTVDNGDFIAITGPNGGGKTTLLRIILRLLSPTEGSVEYFMPDGTPTKELPIGYLPQKNMIDSRFPITVREVVESGLLSKKDLTADTRRCLVDATLAQVDLLSQARQPIGVLSGGQLQRALLGRALVANPGILVMDEPLSYIDKRFEHRLYELIETFKAERTILLVSHEMSVISGMATRHLIVDHTIHECHARSHYIATQCD